MSAIEADDGDVEAVISSGKGGVMVFVVLLDVVTGGDCVVGGLSVISVGSVVTLSCTLGSELQANIRSS